MASIASYLSAEVTRGIWKQVSMNGTDWPSPDANLSNVEQQIKKIVAATGVDVPRIASGPFILAPVCVFGQNTTIGHHSVVLPTFNSQH